jgi:hypothetical protein
VRHRDGWRLISHEQRIDVGIAEDANAVDGIAAVIELADAAVAVDVGGRGEPVVDDRALIVSQYRERSRMGGVQAGMRTVAGSPSPSSVAWVTGSASRSRALARSGETPDVARSFAIARSAEALGRAARSRATEKSVATERSAVTDRSPAASSEPAAGG